LLANKWPRRVGAAPVASPERHLAGREWAALLPGGGGGGGGEIRGNENEISTELGQLGAIGTLSVLAKAELAAGQPARRKAKREINWQVQRDEEQKERRRFLCTGRPAGWLQSRNLISTSSKHANQRLPESG